MKNLILFCFLFILSYSLHSQTTNAVSVGLKYSNLSGLNTELRYGKLLTKRIGVSGSISYNLHKSYTINGGLFYRILDYKLFDLDIGAEYSFTRHSHKYISEEIRSSNLEIPLTFDYYLTSKYSLFGGMSSRINLNNTEPSRLFDHVRIGIKYKW